MSKRSSSSGYPLVMIPARFLRHFVSIRGRFRANKVSSSLLEKGPKRKRPSRDGGSSCVTIFSIPGINDRQWINVPCRGSAKAALNTMPLTSRGLRCRSSSATRPENDSATAMTLSVGKCCATKRACSSREWRFVDML